MLAVHNVPSGCVFPNRRQAGSDAGLAGSGPVGPTITCRTDRSGTKLPWRSRLESMELHMAHAPVFWVP